MTRLGLWALAYVASIVLGLAGLWLVIVSSRSTWNILEFVIPGAK